MKSPRFNLLAAGRSACSAFGRRARRVVCGKSGMAAVEFALILPMMLALYFGCVVLSQGLEAGRKAQLLSRTLADLTAQTLPQTYADGACSTNTSAPCVTDTDLSNIFAAAKAVIYPFTGPATMTISEVVFNNDGSSTGTCCEAEVVWSATSALNGATVPTPRTKCTVLTASSDGQNSATDMPAHLYPGGAKDAGGTSGTNTTDTYMIIADVTYNYVPGFSYQTTWGSSSSSGYMLHQTSYMSPRYGANTSIFWSNPGSSFPSAQVSSCTPSW